MFRLRFIHSPAAIACALTTWLALIACGFCYLTAYSHMPGVASEETLKNWPQAAPQSSYLPSTSKHSLVLFLHPKCACSRATLAELAKLKARHPQLPVSCVFYIPSQQPDQWCETDLWSSAIQLSEQIPTRDWDGHFASSVGATTSGHAFLLASDGSVLYSGGLTSSRGHEGDNRGCDTVDQLLSGSLPASETITLPVFGCSIQSDTRAHSPTYGLARHVVQQLTAGPRVSK